MRGRGEGGRMEGGKECGAGRNKVGKMGGMGNGGGE